MRDVMPTDPGGRWREGGGRVEKGWRGIRGWKRGRAIYPKQKTSFPLINEAIFSFIFHSGLYLLIMCMNA